MGWSSGGELFDKVISVVKVEVPDPAARQRIYTKLIPAFENHDWDTQMECGGDDAYDAALKQLHPEWFEEE
jgi:hypothetical protein